MKKHLVHICFDIKGSHFYFNGFVTAKEQNGKVIISPKKIFKNHFGFEYPIGTQITIK